MINKLGHYAFLIGAAVAIITGFFPFYTNQFAFWLVFLGIIVGLLNITQTETKMFLLASAALLIASEASLGIVSTGNLGQYLEAILTNISVFVAPAAIVVALKAIWAIEEE